MMRLVLGAAVLALVGAGPALAMAPECHDQLAQIKAQMSQTGNTQSALANKYREAERLCAENKEEQAQALAKQIRDEMGQKAGHTPEASGSSTAPGAKTGGAGSK